MATAQAQPVQAVQMTPQPAFAQAQVLPQSAVVAQPVAGGQQQTVVVIQGGPSPQAQQHQSCSTVVFILGFFIPVVFWGGTCLICQRDKTPCGRSLNIASIIFAVILTLTITFAVAWPFIVIGSFF